MTPTRILLLAALALLLGVGWWAKGELDYARYRRRRR